MNKFIVTAILLGTTSISYATMTAEQQEVGLALRSQAGSVELDSEIRAMLAEKAPVGTMQHYVRMHEERLAQGQKVTGTNASQTPEKKIFEPEHYGPFI